jgi:hypothetical protein
MLIKYLGDQPHIGVDLELLAIGGGNAGAFLTAVLEGKQGKKGKSSYIFARGIDPKNTTTLVQVYLPLNLIITQSLP